MSFVTHEDKQTLYKDGYVIFKKAVAEDIVNQALARIKSAKKGERLADDATMTDLINASSVTPILNELMGSFDPPIHCQVGVIKPGKTGEQFNQLDYLEKDQPYYSASSHLDGVMTISVPQSVQKGTPDEIYNSYITTGPKRDLGRIPEVMGHNMVPMFEDPI